MTTTNHSKPVFTKRLGAIRASVFVNEHDGRVYYTTAIVRRYRDKQGAWQDSSSYNGLPDLAALSELLTHVKNWISAREDEAEEARQQQQQGVTNGVAADQFSEAPF